MDRWNSAANDDLHLAAESYRQVGTDFWPGPLSSDGNATTDSANAGQWLRTWKVNRDEINNHMLITIILNIKCPKLLKTGLHMGIRN